MAASVGTVGWPSARPQAQRETEQRYVAEEQIWRQDDKVPDPSALGNSDSWDTVRLVMRQGCESVLQQ